MTTLVIDARSVWGRSNLAQKQKELVLANASTFQLLAILSVNISQIDQGIKGMPEHQKRWKSFLDYSPSQAQGLLSQAVSEWQVPEKSLQVWEQQRIRTASIPSRPVLVELRLFLWLHEKLEILNNIFQNSKYIVGNESHNAIHRIWKAVGVLMNSLVLDERIPKDFSAVSCFSDDKHCNG